MYNIISTSGTLRYGREKVGAAGLLNPHTAFIFRKNVFLLSSDTTTKESRKVSMLNGVLTNVSSNLILVTLLILSNFSFLSIKLNI